LLSRALSQPVPN